MTPEEQAKADDNMRAVIAQMIAETGKLVSETSRLNAEAGKINKKSDWYLLAVGSGATLAIIAIVKLFM